jgi:cellulose synthase/poly-beta-1,6-N-acetylglucosamine synthase-like glycosyltransferase
MTIIIYLLGSLAGLIAFIYGVRIKGSLTLGDLVILIFTMTFSWIGFCVFMDITNLKDACIWRKKD